MRKTSRAAGAAAALAAALFVPPASRAQGWEPSKTVEFVVPAGVGGGADQMAHVVQSIIAKHQLMKQAMVVVNKAGGDGSEGLVDMKGSKGDPHKIIITLSNLFTTPLAQGTPVNWRELTPVQMLALDQFVLWVNAETPYKTSKDYIDAARARSGDASKHLKMGGTGAKQEDQIITAAIEQKTGVKFTYVPFKGGGEVAVELVGKRVDSTVNNPIEAVAQWRGGKLRPLCVFDPKRMPYKAKVADKMGWSDIPTCKEHGLDVDYLMLRGIFMPGGVPRQAVDYYLGVFKKVMATPDWKAFMEQGAFNTTALTGRQFTDWVEREEARHIALMQAAGFIAGRK